MLTIPYKIAVLVFLHNEAGEQLLLLRNKPPNRGLWSPIGGKLEMETGESPFECAMRETFEETGMTVSGAELHLFGMVAERAYEGQAHWLLFLFNVLRPIPALPEAIAEGQFGFFSRESLNTLNIPETDRIGLWPLYDTYRNGFVALRADCRPGFPLAIEIEQALNPPAN